VVYFLDIVSAVEGAKKAWGLHTNPPADQLPELRQISDMAWGIWRRVHSDGEDLHDINTFLMHDIRNDITKQLIAEALRSYKVPDGQKRATAVPTWPGLSFDTNTEEGAALLGKYSVASLRLRDRTPNIVCRFTERYCGWILPSAAQSAARR